MLWREISLMGTEQIEFTSPEFGCGYALLGQHSPRRVVHELTDGQSDMEGVWQR